MVSARRLFYLYRSRNQFTLREFADLLGYSKTTITNVENGLRLPGRDLAIVIQNVTGIQASSWGDVKHTPIVTKLGRPRKAIRRGGR
jgi:transcriptional regulator with XRE-family HTH domain